MKSLVLYDSLTGNTEKVAHRIHHALEAANLTCDLVKVTSETSLDFFDYDLVFIGSPVIQWLPTRTLMDFITGKLREYNRSGHVRPAAPLRPGKFGVCFGTYAGPHIGTTEARPMTLWLRCFLEHIGYLVADEWHVVGQFKNRQEMNTRGRLGNIQGRPDEHDLEEVENRVKGVLSYLSA